MPARSKATTSSMPARLPKSAQSLFSSSSRALNLFYCPSCQLWRRTASRSAAGRARPSTALHARTYASLASSTAINAPKEVQSEYKELYDVLNELKVKGANYVNLSRLGLALRGLETRDPVVRVAVLGLDSRASARKLVRVLLADPLGPEPRWEKQLERIGLDDGRAVLIRWGETEDITSQSSPLSTLSITSPTLKRHNLEILISSLSTGFAPNAQADADFDPLEAILVPAVETPVSAGGRFGVVTYPVHRSLLLGDGVDSIVAYGRYAGDRLNPEATGDMVKAVFGLPAPATASQPDIASSYETVDVSLASTALAKFRESLSNSTVYEQGWFRSNMPALTRWLTHGTQPPSPGAMKPVIRDLIDSLISSAESQLLKAETRHLQSLTAASFPIDHARTAILASLSTWAERAHTELRDQLDIAFAGRSWRKLAWWELFWRVDDVGMLTSEILDRRYLINAEKEAIWLAGRVGGLFTTPAHLAEEALTASTNAILSSPPPASKPRRLGSAPPEPTFADILPLSLRSGTTGVDDTDPSTFHPSTQQQPWPPDIALSRAHLAHTTLPRLTALAQTLTLQSLSGISLSAALSALTYISLSPTVSAFTTRSSSALADASGTAPEGVVLDPATTTAAVADAASSSSSIAAAVADAVAATGADPLSTSLAIFGLGAVWTLRRLQRKWEAARAAWEAEVREEGRRALRETEGAVKEAVDGAVRGLKSSEVDEGVVQERRVVRELLSRGRRVLERVK